VSAIKWKIQTASVNGWADVKVSVDDGPYEDDHFNTIEEALAQMADYITCGSSDGTDYRVVQASVRQDDDLY
jgi:hypothetical protein